MDLLVDRWIEDFEENIAFIRDFSSLTVNSWCDRPQSVVIVAQSICTTTDSGLTTSAERRRLDVEVAAVRTVETTLEDVAMANQFVLDIAEVKAQAAQHMDRGAVTDGNQSRTSQVIDVLNDVVATEIVCYMRYQRHAISAAGINSGPVAAEFAEHAAAELRHAMSAAERVNQLGGDPDLSPEKLAERSHTDYKAFDDADLEGMLQENLIAERIVIEIYQQVIRWLGEDDPTTRRLLESILAEEEEHADDLADLLTTID